MFRTRDVDADGKALKSRQAWRKHLLGSMLPAIEPQLQGLRACCFRYFCNVAQRLQATRLSHMHGRTSDYPISDVPMSMQHCMTHVSTKNCVDIAPFHSLGGAGLAG